MVPTEAQKVVRGPEFNSIVVPVIASSVHAVHAMVRHPYTPKC